MDPNAENDHESVEFSADMAAAIAREEEAAAAKKKSEEEEAAGDADDNLFDDDDNLFGDDDDEDEAGGDDDGSDDDADGDDGDDGDDDRNDAGDSRDDAGRGDGDKKKPSDRQKRIKDLARKRREAEAAAFEAEMKNIELENRLAALEQQRTQAPAPSAMKEPKADDFQYGEVDPAYVEALVEYKTAKKTAELQDAANQQAEADKQERLKTHYQKKLGEVQVEGKKRFGDAYDDVVNRTRFPGTLALEILDSDKAVDISYYLAKNIGKLRELSTMDAVKRAKMIGRLEERFSARSSAAKKRSNAPDSPGDKKKSRKKPADKTYGPDDQDVFDKAFFGN